jgi:riboflavin kinase/FMN adenylyltransferase
VVTLGVFDGLHRGHARLLARAVALGAQRGLPVVLVTFDPHPATVAGPSRDTSPLAGVTRRAQLARAHGADAVLVLPFDDVMASTAADRFAVDVLVRALSATDVVVGVDFRFGNRGAGDVPLLKELGGRHGFLAHGVPLLTGFSSTRIRRLLEAGDVAAAAQLLGRPHQVEGTVVNGRILVNDVVLPRPGRYRVLVNDTPAIANVVSGELRIPGEGRLVVRFLARH